MMVALRNTYKYHFKVGNKIVLAGITGDLARREQEHQQHRGWSKGRIKQVGDATSRDAAIVWEIEQAAKGMPVRA